MRLALMVVVLAGCYGPSYKDCEVTCASGNGCPSGLTCDEALGVCRTEGHGAACGSPGDDAGGDAAVDADTRQPVCQLTQISAGAGHTCALDSTGKVYCWGTNVAGESSGAAQTTCPIPSGQSVGCNPTPMVVGGLTGVTRVDTPYLTSCAVVAGPNGKIFCWGDNTGYQYGDGTTTSSPTPKDVARNGSGVVGGVQHMCSIGGQGFQCSGLNQFGQVGDGSVNPAMTARFVTPQPVTIAGAGLDHTCAVFGSQLSCWGHNESHQVGPNATTGEIVPSPISVPGAGGVTQVVGGDRHTCFLNPTLVPRCFGDNTKGQGGDGTTITHPQVTDAQITQVKQLAAGGLQTCALKQDGTVWCWGSRDGTDAGIVRMPAQIAMPAGTTATQITVGSQHACALLDDKTAFCWGDNTFGQHGDGTTTGTAGVRAKVCLE